MTTKHSFRLVWLALAGLGIGWIVGLSVSPVAAIVISAFLSLACAATATLAGVELSEGDDFSQDEGNKKNKTKRRVTSVDASPIAIMVVCVAISATFGVWAREHEWFASTPASETPESVADVVTEWTKWGKEKADIVDRLFDIAYPAPRPGVTPTAGMSLVEQQPAQPRGGIYSGLPQDVCVELKAENRPDALMNLMLTRDDRLGRLASRLSEADLPVVVSILCPDS